MSLHTIFTLSYTRLKQCNIRDKFPARHVGPELRSLDTFFFFQEHLIFAKILFFNNLLFCGGHILRVETP